jgi:hypothetical protein
LTAPGSLAGWGKLAPLWQRARASLVAHRSAAGRSLALEAVALFAFAFGLRLVWVNLVESPYDNIWSDMGGYVRRALQVATGAGDPAPQFVTFCPPGTHLLLAAEMLLLGWKHHALVLTLHCAWGAVVAPCAMLLAARFVPRPWIAIVFGVVVAVWQPLLAFSGYFSSEQFDAALLALSAWLLVRQVESGRSTLALGASTALAYLVRPQVLLTALLLAVGALVIVVQKPAGAPRLRPWRLAIALSILAGAVVFGAVRYHTITGHYELISDNSAMMRLFADTNYSKVRSNEGYFFEAPSKVQVGEHRELVVTGYVGEPAPLERARREEVAHMKLLARVRRFGWNMSLLFVGNDLWPESSHLGKQGWRRAFNDVTKYLFLVIVCPLALVGSLSCNWKPRTALVVATAHVFTALVVAGFFLGECRYRVPYDPFFLLLALEGLLVAWQWGRSQVVARTTRRVASAA